MICPICNQQTSPTESDLPKFSKCNLCGGNFLRKKVRSSYPEEYFDQKGTSSFVSTLAKPFLDLLLRLKIKNILILSGVKNPRILDYGCGSGKLVERLLEYGVDAKGFEPSRGALNITNRKKLPVFNKLKAVKGGYNLIMFWHSLEHTYNPYQVIIDVKKLLSKKGKVLIAVPNGDSFEAKIAKEKWFHYTYPLHTLHFTPKSINMMLKEAGFKNISIDHFNPEYTVTGLAQTFLNIFLPMDILYGVVTHRRLSIPLSFAIIISLVSIFLIIFFSPLLIIFFIIQLIFGSTGAMVVTAQRS